MAKKSPADQVAAQRVIDLQREYRTVAAEEYIRSTVDAAPPLTETQRAKLAALLHPAAFLNEAA